VRRAVLGVAGAALLLALTSGPASATGIPGARASGECTWAKHSKRVTKKVRSHGRLRRVKRKKVWWSCDPTASAVAPSPVSTTPPIAPEGQTEPEPEPQSELAHLGVRAQPDFKYTLSRPEVDAGKVSIQLQNEDGDPHDLNVQLEGGEGDVNRIPVVAPESQTSETFDLAPGTYRLWCDLPEHDELGMHAQLVVSAASGS
jgi:plastocyanin